MKIVIATSQVPFSTGGAEIHAQLLKEELIKRGHKADIVTIPLQWYPADALVNSMMMGRMMDVREANGETIDMVIAMKFPAIYCKHDNKVLWLLHQHRQAYDLWNTPYGDLHNLEDGTACRELIIKCDNDYIPEAKRIFTNAQNVANRLKNSNGIESTALYHPPKDYEKLHCESYGDFVFYPSRINSTKRQRVVVEAAKYMKSDAKVYIAGSGVQTELDYLNEIIDKNGLQEKVKLLGFISDEDKISYYANCLCVYFGAFDEDYGYITLEGFFSKKPVIVHKDAGGPLEFVEDGKNGFVLEDEARLVAAKIDALYENRAHAKQLGEAGYQSMLDKNINWDNVIAALLGES